MSHSFAKAYRLRRRTSRPVHCGLYSTHFLSAPGRQSYPRGPWTRRHVVHIVLSDSAGQSWRRRPARLSAAAAGHHGAQLRLRCIPRFHSGEHLRRSQRRRGPALRHGQGTWACALAGIRQRSADRNRGTPSRCFLRLRSRATPPRRCASRPANTRPAGWTASGRSCGRRGTRTSSAGSSAPF